MDGAFDELVARRLNVNLDLLLRSQHQPTFLHADAGVGAKFEAVVFVAGEAYLDRRFVGAGYSYLASSSQLAIDLRAMLHAVNSDERLRVIDPV